MPDRFGPTDPVLRRRVGLWLAIWAAMLVLTVVVGGVTRLTEAGLSITQWRPIAGIMPPLSAADWEREFAGYRQIPEFAQVHSWMTLADFKRIFLTEYVHRLWARFVGLAFALPLLWFAVKGGLGRPLVRRLVALLVLTGLQGAMGWYMVKSGLTGRTSVSQYRLAAHLAVALVIFAVTVWTAADLLVPVRTETATPAPRWLRRAAAAFGALVFLNAVAGAFVAGLDAGKAYNTFPLMDGRIVPLGYGQLSPWVLNLFENVAAVQFNHRLIGTVILAAALALWVASRTVPISVGARRVAAGVTGMAVVQMSLGIATLLLVVPVTVAALHQAGAVLLLALALLLVHRLRLDTP